MDICVLGPLVAVQSGVSVTPTAAKPRSLLALLASYAGHVTPIDVIIAELWEDDPPPSVLTTIQTYVLQLRRLIGRAPHRSVSGCPKDILRTEPGGYLLDRAEGRFDVDEHSRLATRGHEAFQSGDFARAKASMQAALDLWRGPAYVDVQTGPRLAAHATFLEESRRTILDRRIAADLRLGRHHELIGELAGLTSEHPTDEQLHAYFMIALYRVGRRSQALTVFGRLRTKLATELGVDPTLDVERLYHSMLTAKPAIEPEYR
jgi:SARP family transcriptional regulator, regulator of embCAB operon